MLVLVLKSLNPKPFTALVWLHEDTSASSGEAHHEHGSAGLAGQGNAVLNVLRAAKVDRTHPAARRQPVEEPNIARQGPPAGESLKPRIAHELGGRARGRQECLHMQLLLPGAFQ